MFIKILFGLLLGATTYTLVKLISSLGIIERFHVRLCETNVVILWGIVVATVIQIIFGTSILFITTLKDGAKEGFLCDLDGFATSACTFVIINQFALLCCCCCCDYSKRGLLKVIGILCICWSLPIFWSSLPFFGIGKYIPHGNQSFCCLNWESENIYDVIYFYALFIFAFLPPSLVIISSIFKRNIREVNDEYQVHLRVHWIALLFLLLWVPFGGTTMHTLFGYKTSGTAELVALVSGLTSYVIVPYLLSRQLDSFRSKVIHVG